MNPLTNISPIDGRYYSKVSQLSNIFSEYGLIKQRVYVEIKYLAFLLKTLEIDFDQEQLETIINNFDITDAQTIKDIERTTNHDVKAVEYFIKDKLPDNLKEFVHFGLTSQDINSMVYTWQMREGVYELMKYLDTLLKDFNMFAANHSNIAMLSKTHGQPATTTTVGYQINVFRERINNQYMQLECIKYKTKFGGAVGSLNAHRAAYPLIDWLTEMDKFVELFGFTRHQFTTQIDHYDNHSEVMDIIKRINVILTDFCVDMWLYISNNYFVLKQKEGEIGSSTMPHKVNPINFENAEGNLLLANNLLTFMSSKLPISRLQRDLTDSTILRNMGVAFGHTVIAYQNIITGFSKLKVNYEKLVTDLEANWVIIAEAIQTILRREGISGSYELVKKFVTNYPMPTEEQFDTFIMGLDVKIEIKKELLELNPITYRGYA